MKDDRLALPCTSERRLVSAPLKRFDTGIEARRRQAIGSILAAVDIPSRHRRPNLDGLADEAMRNCRSCNRKHEGRDAAEHQADIRKSGELAS